jgi:hypothetical protein
MWTMPGKVQMELYWRTPLLIYLLLFLQHIITQAMLGIKKVNITTTTVGEVVSFAMKDVRIYGLIVLSHGDQVTALVIGQGCQRPS